MASETTHSTPAANSPDPLLRPLTIRGLTLKNRIMSSAHACGTDEGGLTGLRFQRYHEEKAKGGLALTMFGGSSNVAPDSPSVFQQLNIGTDAAIPHLQEFSARIHRHGCAIMCQITHLGRRGEDSADWWLPTIAPTRSRETLHRSFAREMDRHDIARVVRAFGEAAKRCEEGGLDGIETLAGGHLIGQFLGPDTNRRSDAFGGSLENRARFALMVYEEMRKSVSDRFLLGIRLSVDDDNPEGLSAADALAFAGLLEREGAVDFFNAIFGRMDTELGLAEQNMPGMSMPLAPWLKPVARFREQVSLPVFHAARITDVATARHAIREGLLDMAAMTRAHIADPQIVNKIAAGQEDRIRPCVGATHCMHNKPYCIHNPVTGREREMPQVIERSAAPGRKVVIVGGGPAGLEAARVAAERGHDVVLFEAAPRLGGQVLIAAAAWWRGDLMGVIDWRAAELDRLGVDQRSSTYAEAADVLECAPDVVIIATGGAPDTDWLPGVAHCTSGWDLMTGAGHPGREVLIWDGTGRQAAASYADQLSRAGAEVTLISRDDRVAAEVPYAERAILRKHLAAQEVTTVFEERLVRVARDGNRLTAVFANELTGDEITRSADQVVAEHGTSPVDEVFQALKEQSVNDGVTDIAALIAGQGQPPGGAGFELYRIGDAVSSRSIHAAMLDAYRLCCRL